MTKCYLLYLAIACCLAGALLCAFMLTGATDPITQANFERLTYGMTRDQVEQILGGPAGDFSGGTSDPTAPIIIVDGQRSYSILDGHNVLQDWSNGEI